MNTFSKKKYGF